MKEFILAGIVGALLAILITSPMTCHQYEVYKGHSSLSVGDCIQGESWEEVYVLIEKGSEKDMFKLVKEAKGGGLKVGRERDVLHGFLYLYNKVTCPDG